MDEQGPILPPPIAFQDPEERSRAPWAWILLGAIFLALILLQNQPNKDVVPGSKLDAADLSSELKMALISKEAPKLLGSEKRTDQTGAGDDLLKKILVEVEPDKAKDPLAAKYVLAVGHELGKPADPVALKTLQTSKVRNDQVFAEVYGGKTLPDGWVASHEDQLPKNFLGKVVASHAGKPGESRPAIGQSDLVALLLFMFMAVVILLGGLGVIGTFIAMTSSGKIRPIGTPLGPISKQSADRLALRMCLFFVAFSLVPSIVATTIRGKFALGVASLIGDLVFLGVFIWMNTIPVFGVADPVRKLFGRTKPVGKLIAFGIAAFAANLPITAFAAVITAALFKGGPKPTHPLSEQLGLGASPVTVLVFFLLACVSAPVLEELSFRGMLFPGLARYMKPWMAMLLSGFLFASIHPQGPMLWAALGSIGAVSACLTYYTGSLLPSMVMHAIHNCAIMTLAVVFLM